MESDGGDAEPEPQIPVESDPKKSKTKKTGPVRRILLNEDILCGKNGLIKLQDLFSGFQFKGRKHEKEDLDKMLHKLEHWMHVMHSRFPFDQTLERIEFLGVKKKLVKTHVKKIRMGLISVNDATQDDQVVELEFEGGPSDDEMGNAPQVNTRIEIPATNNADEFPDEEDFLMMNNPDQNNVDEFPDEEDFIMMNNSACPPNNPNEFPEVEDFLMPHESAPNNTDAFPDEESFNNLAPGNAHKLPD